MLLCKFVHNIIYRSCRIQNNLFTGALSYLVRCLCDLSRGSLQTQVGVQNVL